MISGAKGLRSTFRNQPFVIAVGVDGVPEDAPGLVNGIQNL
jgi:hypothetical protein